MSIPYLRTAASVALKIPLALLARGMFAQSSADDAAALGACAACSGIMILIPIAFIALNIALMIWVAKDSKARGMDNTVVWMVLALFLSLLGLVIYILSRPKGELVPCASCGNKRMHTSAKCPHCGNA